MTRLSTPELIAAFAIATGRSAEEAGDYLVKVGIKAELAKRDSARRKYHEILSQIRTSKPT